MESFGRRDVAIGKPRHSPDEFLGNVLPFSSKTTARFRYPMAVVERVSGIVVGGMRYNSPMPIKRRQIAFTFAALTGAALFFHLLGWAVLLSANQPSAEQYRIGLMLVRDTTMAGLAGAILTVFTAHVVLLRRLAVGMALLFGLLGVTVLVSYRQELFQTTYLESPRYQADLERRRVRNAYLEALKLTHDPRPQIHIVAAFPLEGEARYLLDVIFIHAPAELSREGIRLNRNSLIAIHWVDVQTLAILGETTPAAVELLHRALIVVDTPEGYGGTELITDFAATMAPLPEDEAPAALLELLGDDG